MGLNCGYCCCSCSICFCFLLLLFNSVSRTGLGGYQQLYPPPPNTHTHARTRKNKQHADTDARIKYHEWFAVITDRETVDMISKSVNSLTKSIALAATNWNETKERRMIWVLSFTQITTQSQVPLPLIFLSCYAFTILPALSALCQTHAC